MLNGDVGEMESIIMLSGDIKERHGAQRFWIPSGGGEGDELLWLLNSLLWGKIHQVWVLS